MSNNTDNIAELNCQKFFEISSEYRSLFRLDSLNQEQRKRMETILEQATENEELDFWISQVESDEGANSDLLDKHSRNSYRNQRALMSEHIDIENPYDSPLSNPSLGLDVKEPFVDYSSQLDLLTACEPGKMQRNETYGSKMHG